MKKILSILLSVMLLCGVAAGLAETTEPVTLTLFQCTASTIPTNILDNPVMNKITEDTGVIIDWSPYMGEGNSSETAARLMAANELPDIWILNDTTIIQNLINNGLVLPLDDLLANAPNVTEIAEKAMNFAKFSFSTDKIYLVPTQIGGLNWYHNGYDNVFHYRYDLWIKAGRPELKTSDDFIAFMEKCKELEPVNFEGLENYAIGLDLGQEVWVVTADHVYAQGMSGNWIWNYDVSESTIHRGSQTGSPIYNGIKFYNKLYQKGLLDPESATMKIDQVQAKGTSWRYFFGMATWEQGFMNDAVRSEQKKLQERKDNGETLTEAEENILGMGWVPIVLDNTEGDVYARTKSPYGNGSYYLISSTCKDPEAAMRFIDWFASWDGSEIASNGVEGYNWEYRDGVPHWFTQDEVEAKKAEGVTFLSNKEMGISYVAPLLLVNGNRQDPRGWPAIYSQADVTQFKNYMSAGERVFAEENGYAYGMQYIDDNFSPTDYSNAPLISLIPAIDPTSELEMIRVACNDIYNEYVVALVYAEDDAAFDALWEQYLEEVTAAGYDELFAHYEEGFNNAKAIAEEMGF